MQNKKEIFKEIIRFLFVGGLATLIDYIVFYLFNLIFLIKINSKINIIISTALGFTAGLFVNWFLQKYVFKYLNNELMKSKKVFAKFVLLSLCGLAITQIGMFIGQITIFNTLFVFNIDFWKLFTKCLMTGIVLIINYLGRKYIVFKE
ncbi:MAG: GtrA family protein [Anaeroplasma sp.]